MEYELSQGNQTVRNAASVEPMRQECALWPFICDGHTVEVAGTWNLYVRVYLSGKTKSVNNITWLCICTYSAK